MVSKKGYLTGGTKGQNPLKGYAAENPNIYNISHFLCSLITQSLTYYDTLTKY